MNDQSIPRRLFVLALPIIGLNVLAVLALAIDTAMCGRLPEAERALEALGYATQIVFLLMVLMMGLIVGAVALVSRAFGAGRMDRVNHLLFQSTMLTVILGAIVGVAGNLVAPSLLDLLGASAEVQPTAMAYLRPLLTCVVFSYLNFLYAAVLRGIGNTRLAFLIALASTVVNVVLNYGLILGNFGLPAMGVAGAAWSTVVSQLFSVVAMVIAIRRGVVPGITLPLSPRRIDGALAREMFGIGAPAALDMVILNAGFMAIIGMLGRIESSTVAAHGVGLRIQSLAFVPGMSVAQATGALVGQALGARNAGQARAVLRASLVLCTGIMGLLGALILLFDEPILALFDIDASTTVGTYALLWIRILGYSMPIFGLHMAFVGLLQGSGATRLSLWINFLTTLFVQIPIGYLLGFPLALAAFGVWMSFPAAFAVKALLELIAYKRGTWATLGTRVH